MWGSTVYFQLLWRNGQNKSSPVFFCEDEEGRAKTISTTTTTTTTMKTTTTTTTTTTGKNWSHCVHCRGHVGVSRGECCCCCCCWRSYLVKHTQQHQQQQQHAVQAKLGQIVNNFFSFALILSDFFKSIVLSSKV